MWPAIPARVRRQFVDERRAREIAADEKQTLDTAIPDAGPAASLNADDIEAVEPHRVVSGERRVKRDRDFRGAMVGRSDKGPFITTGTFTLDANREAKRDGAPAIDLIDGDKLCDLLKQLKLGVKAEMVERMVVDAVWFDGL
jgi:hypothetical protein